MLPEHTNLQNINNKSSTTMFFVANYNRGTLDVKLEIAGCRSLAALRFGDMVVPQAKVWSIACHVQTCDNCMSISEVESCLEGYAHSGAIHELGLRATSPANFPNSTSIKGRRTAPRKSQNLVLKISLEPILEWNRTHAMQKEHLSLHRTSRMPLYYTTISHPTSPLPTRLGVSSSNPTYRPQENITKRRSIPFISRV